MDSIDPPLKTLKPEGIFLLILGLSTAACLGGALVPPEEAVSEEEPAQVYRVKGTRDGPSFFPEQRYPEVQPLKAGKLDFQHYPTYGEIYSFLQEWALRSARFNLFLARHLPQIQITGVKTENLEPGLYSIQLSFTNVGHLPTALKQAKLVKIVRPDTAKIEFQEELVDAGKVEVVEPSLRSKDIEADWLDPGQTRTVAWKVRLKDVERIKAEVSIHSTRVGVDRREVTITKIPE